MRKLIAALALAAGLVMGAVQPAQAHYDHWHQATCQPGGQALWYNWPSAYGGTRVIYWRYTEGYINVDTPFLDAYAQMGYECGFGHVLTNAWIQQVCEFGYCGQGMIQAFAYGQLVRHFGGPAAGWVAVHWY